MPRIIQFVKAWICIPYAATLLEVSRNPYLLGSSLVSSNGIAHTGGDALWNIYNIPTL
ncbi:MAG TPA: hypothetical protein V6D11_00105 [Waterburya sp.]